MEKYKILLLLTSLMFVSYIAEAQTISVLKPSTENISEEVSVLLHNRLTQAVTLNGMASTDDSNSFLLIPVVTVVSIEPTTMPPIRYIAEVEVLLCLFNNNREWLVSSEILTKKGVGSTETKAIQEAIRSIKARDSKLKKFIVNGKKKIVEYNNADMAE